MIEDLARQLAAQLRETPEYKAFQDARERAFADEQTAALLGRFHRLEMMAQARRLSGGSPGAEEEELKKLGELLQFSPDAADYLLAEYTLNRLISGVYDIIGRGAGVDFSQWEA